ncbi:sulfotransferase domain-containing protein [Bacillus taeanensis]|uniref:Sulfotransferase domain-containing protein n=1 Tax=Bacillus taeanensis TaxID=273032 RepID=A0A366XT93_9BACI|nr:sulfotransferase domain-containing protein [Bacillus taeanensis]RBW68886.1 hypothetical protein DS031_14205 [Bacillus taeanensis]
MLIHIGYHKTGTTWFQKTFFKEHSQLTTPFSYEEIVEKIVYPHSLHFNGNSTKIFFEDKIQECLQKGETSVLSSERLSGNPHSGGYDSKEIADRLYEVFPKAKIWIVIRNQIDIIASNYKQYVREGGTGTVRNYLKGDPPERIPSFSLQHFEYFYLIKYYQDLFGKENVMVSLYEDFKSNPNGLIKDLCKFIGINQEFNYSQNKSLVNKSFSDLSIKILRPTNIFNYYPSMAQYPVINLPGRFLLRRSLRVMDKAVGKQVAKNTIKNEVREIIGNYYEESNNELSKLLNINLHEKGYM